jgi:SEC-C motif domain protein
MKQCPCGSGKAYSECCEPFHLGKEPASALELMSQRYSAYAMRHPEYIQRTTHPKSPYFKSDLKEWKKEILQFSDSTEFVRLEILGFGQDWVHFAAHLKQAGKTVKRIEKSRFERLDANWRYVEPILFIEK